MKGESFRYIGIRNDSSKGFRVDQIDWYIERRGAWSAANKMVYYLLNTCRCPEIEVNMNDGFFFSIFDCHVLPLFVSLSYTIWINTI